jgi:glucose-fructose oxidoreductase
MVRTRALGGRRGDKVRFAVIGQGHFAQSAVLPAFAGAKRCELRAIFSDDDAKLRLIKRAYGVEHALGYEHYDEFLSSGAVDAVYIALPNDMHADYTVRAARAGIHVLCEKPMATTTAEAERMIAACEQADVKLMIAYRLHFDEANLSAIEALEDGRIGEPRFFSSTFSQQVAPGNTRTRPAPAGGPLGDIGIYCINAARYLFRAEPTDVVALAATKKQDPRFRKIPEQVSAVLHFPGQRLAQLICSFGAFQQSSYTVVGTKGFLRLEPAYGLGDLGQEIVTDAGTRRRTFKQHDQVAPELDEMAACIREDRDPEPSGHEGLADLRVMEAIEASLVSGRRADVRAVHREQRPSIQQRRRVRIHGHARLVHVRPPHHH